MKMNKTFWLPLALVMAAAPAALADNVVVAPQGGTTTQPAQTPTPVYVQPAPVQPVQQAPLVDEPRKRSQVNVDVAPPRNYAATIALSALMGGLTGALVGGAIYYLDNQDQPRNIAYWAAGGVLVGTGVGVAQIMVQESRVNQAVSLNRLPSDPAPTFKLALYRATF